MWTCLANPTGASSVSTVLPSPYTSSWVTSISTANRTLTHTKHNTKRECLIYLPCGSSREKWQGKYEATSVCILKVSAGQWHCYLLQTIKGRVRYRKHDEPQSIYLRQISQYTVEGHRHISLPARCRDFSVFDKATRGGGCRHLNVSAAHRLVPSPLLPLCIERGLRGTGSVRERDEVRQWVKAMGESGIFTSLFTATKYWMGGRWRRGEEPRWGERKGGESWVRLLWERVKCPRRAGELRGQDVTRGCQSPPGELFISLSSTLGTALWVARCREQRGQGF